MSDPARQPERIRVCIQQPALPAYRVPVFAEFARRPGIEVEVLFSSRAKLPNVDAEGFVARQIQERRLLRWPREVRWVPAQFEAVDRARADVAVLEYNSGVPSLLLALRKARRCGVGAVLWGHGYSVRDNATSRHLRNWLGSQADAVLLYSDDARRRMIDEGMPAERVFVAPNALDQEPIQAARDAWLADPERLEAFKREQGLDGRPVVLFVSRLYPNNRVDLLLHAAARLSESHRDLVVAVVGDGQEREPLVGLAQRLGVADRVRFPGAVYGEDRLAPWFLSSRVFCYPSYMGLSVMHALGYGLPVVTSGDMDAHGPEARVVAHGRNGLLVDLGEPGSLADAIAQLVDDPALAARMGEAGRREVLDGHTVPAMVDGHEAAVRFALRKALERGHSR